VSDQDVIKIQYYFGGKHNHEHDPQKNKVMMVLQDLRRCHSTRTTTAKRGKKRIKYEVYWSSKYNQYTIVGITNNVRMRGRNGKSNTFSGYIMVITGAKLVKTFYHFTNRKEKSFANMIVDYKCYSRVDPKDFPFLDITDVTLRVTCQDNPD
jgi:hypothetical protein